MCVLSKGQNYGEVSKVLNSGVIAGDAKKLDIQDK